MQDAFNLAWKLAYVVKGWANAALLESYGQERVPVGQQIVARANQSRFDYKHLKAVFGFDQGVKTQAQMLECIFAEDEQGATIRAQLYAALEIKHYEFNAQGVELNQRYCSNAVLNDNDAEVFVRDPQLYLQETTRPGAKIPHTWLIDRRGVKRSTLDITGKGRFTLVTGLSGKAWRKAAQALALDYLDVVQVGQVDYRDVYGTWQKKSQISEQGAILVRPDGYIAWRLSAAKADLNHQQTLSEVLKQLNLSH